MTRLAGIDVPAPPFVVLPLFVAALLLVAGLATRAVSGILARWFTNGEAPRLGIPVGGGVVIGGLLMVVPELGLPARLGHWLYLALVLAFVLACAMGTSRLAVSAVNEYARRHPSVNPALGVARVGVRILIGILAVVTALEALGVPVAPLLTTLGVGSLALALALQETLANLFAGLYLLADRPVRAGDYIKIHDGEEGYVETIGWRSARLRTLKNNVVIVPNQKLSQAILTNYHLPSPPVATSVAVTVSYDADPAAVEAALGEELRGAAADVAEIHRAPGSEPTVRLVELSDSGMAFACFFQVRDVEAQATAGHHLRKRILARLRRDGVALALPQRVLRRR